MSSSSSVASSESRPRLTATPNLAERYDAVRAFSATLCAPLEIEDYVVQSMPDVSPTRWHLSHTTWFFETFVLQAADPAYQGTVLFHLFSGGKPGPLRQVKFQWICR